jgi:Glycogen synthase
MDRQSLRTGREIVVRRGGNATRKVCPRESRRDNQRIMRILLAASEMEPFASTGPFGTAIDAIARELAARGHEVSVALPWYREARENAGSKAKRTGARFSVPLGGAKVPCAIRETRTKSGVQVFFIERDEFFDRTGLYGTGDGDYQDNAARFIFFSKCVVELAKRLDPAPDILHAHNWQAALVPVFASEQRVAARTVLTAHTLEYQGNFWSYDFALTNLPPHWFSPRGLEYYGSMNLLKAGILLSDAVVLPGSRLASEAQKPSFGCGLDPVLRENATKLEGILNGMETDVPIPADKTKPRASWASRAGFDDGGPFLLTVTDAMTGDGMELALPAMDRLAEAGARLAVLGRVSRENLAAMEFARRRHAGRLAWFPEFDDALLAGALAGSDALLCPAPIAPDCTIAARAIRHGLPPIAIACGGLHRFAPAWSRADDTGFAFPFYRATSPALVDAARFAGGCFRDSETWTSIVARARAEDFSWARNAAETEALYASILARFGMLRAA